MDIDEVVVQALMLLEEIHQNDHDLKDKITSVIVELLDHLGYTVEELG